MNLPKPVFIDGLLYVLIALFGAMEITFSNDDTYKYVNMYFLFWAKTVVCWAAALVGALKMYRSTTYSDHLKSQQDKQNLIDGSNKITTQTTETKINETQVSPPIVAHTP